MARQSANCGLSLRLRALLVQRVRRLAGLLHFNAAVRIARWTRQRPMNTPDLSSKQASAAPLARGWLYGVAALIFAMVIVGGATRLTESGLSITEWKPLLGAIPPLSEADWQAAFEKYKTIPEYKLINTGMSLAEFKAIYWWEWAHRFLGRFIGVAFLVPFLWFAATGRIARRRWPAMAGLFVLGGLQGALGWYMVKSGLVERTDVSQYRLAAHLTLASIIYGAMVWTGLGYGRHRSRPPLAGFFLIVLIIGQIILGAFVAGLDAGQGYNTWPLMDGALIPDGLGIMSPGWKNLFENAMTVQFNHRIVAYLLVLCTAAYIWHTRRTAGALINAALGLAVAGQAVLGIATLLARVPLPLGLAHQAGALVTLTIAIVHLHQRTLHRTIAGVRPAQA